MYKKLMRGRENNSASCKNRINDNLYSPEQNKYKKNERHYTKDTLQWYKYSTGGKAHITWSNNSIKQYHGNAHIKDVINQVSSGDFQLS